LQLELKPIAESGIREAAFLQVQILTTFWKSIFWGVFIDTLRWKVKIILIHILIHIMIKSLVCMRSNRINSPDQILAHQETIMQDLFWKCNNEP